MLPLLAAAAEAAPEALSIASTVGSKALSVAQKYAPKAYQAAKSIVGKSGQNIDTLAANGNANVQASIVSTLLKNGLSADLFAERGQLTSAEQKKYANLLNRFRQSETSASDAQAAAKPSTGDAYLDGLETNLQIQNLLMALNISSEAYAQLIRGVHTHTSADIERFQLDRRLRQLRPM